MSAVRKRKLKWIKRLSYVILLLTGGAGLGDWNLSEESVLRQIFGMVREHSGGTGGEALKDGLVGAISRLDSFHRSGTFEVKVDRVTLDEADFREGQTVDIQARVLRVGNGGKLAVVWDSRKYGPRPAVVGRDELTAGWPERPFEIAWQPGDRLLLEVWNCKGLRISRLFVIDRIGDDDEFPLRSGTLSIGLHADGTPVRDPKANTIALESRRLRETPAAADVDDVTELAEKPLVIR
jgi:hypothetical protein